jgi:AcrR family transcriptional regulator
VAVTAPQTARARVRAELTREIISAAQDELASEGASALSLRAVARRLGMVPSALYRYFPSRDGLLTALIIDAYRAVGAAAAGADASSGPDPAHRWRAVTSAVRKWAADHPHQWALVYGSPVPDYEAPRETVEAALVITGVIAGIFADALPVGSPRPAGLPVAPEDLADVVAPMEAELLPGRPAEVVAAVFMAWTQLIGMVSLELFGHYEGATTDFDRVFDYCMGATGHLAGLA